MLYVDQFQKRLTLTLQLGGGVNYPPDGRFTLLLQNRLVVTYAFVNFREYVWAKNAEEIFQISPLLFPIWPLKNGHSTEKG